MGINMKRHGAYSDISISKCRKIFTRIFRVGIFLISSTAVCIPAAAQGEGVKTVRIVVGFPPGQATDQVARVLADSLSVTGRSWIVENKPGQGGSLALGAVARSPRDGSVVALGAVAAYAINPWIYSSISYDTLRDFEPVGIVADLPFVLVINPSNTVSSVQELVLQLSKNPGKYSHSSSGTGTLSHFMMEDFKKRAGIQMTHVPYQGSVRALTDVAAGNVDVALETLGAALPLIRGGRLKLLAVGTSSRLAAFPQVPTLSESGFPGFEAVAWLGMSAPTGTPYPIREKLNAEVRAVISREDVVAKLISVGAIPRYGSVQDFDKFLKSEHSRWRTVVRDSGWVPE
jgi:tripartite-type tricarboxylate transporter receptor subunit TctC